MRRAGNRLRQRDRVGPRLLGLRRIAGITFATALASLLVPRASAADADAAFAADLARGINAYRAEHGLKPLAIDTRLTSLARQHSAAMAKSGSMSHAGFEARFRASGYRTCVENVGWNLRTPAAQLDAWRRSPPHDRNLRDPRIARLGLAEHGGYVTMLACA
jgi:uncharacterized protein YkwD